ncbi:PucR family transcriptional regulator [Companilactobacillus jidongensis]|uniref:PucR family transcriptional regulator n=1 Tax=Companilactobacillus jidongensis TaxID=2486006 RepID=UPI000F7A6641|nr:helix-turn-helix domain-containing protein [Companilactobacillus jidongensis]
MQFSELINDLSEYFVIGHINVTGKTDIKRIQIKPQQIQQKDSDIMYIGKNQADGPLELLNFDKDENFENSAVVLCPCQVNQADNVLSNEPLIRVFNQANTILEKVQNQNSAITNLAMDAVTDNPKTNINRAAQLLNNTLMIIDTKYQILLYSDVYGFTDPLWSGILKQGYCSYDFIRAVKEIVRTQSEYKKAVYNVPCPKSNFHRRVTNLYNKNQLLGFLVMFDDQSVFDDRTKELLPEVGKILSSQIVRNHLSAPTESNRDRLLNVLLTEQQSVNVENMFASQQVKLPDAMVLLSCEPLTKQSLSGIQQQLKHGLNAYFPQILSTIYQHHCLGLLPISLSDYHSEKFGNILLEVAQKAHCNIFVSNFYTKPTDTKAAYTVCKRTMKLSQVSEPVVFCEDQYFELMLARINHDAILPFFVNPALQALQKYDSVNDTELVPTLLSYLQQDGNLSRTASVLFIHRNTLHNRIERMEELTGIDLRDANTRFKLYCSFRLKEYIS